MTNGEEFIINSRDFRIIRFEPCRFSKEKISAKIRLPKRVNPRDFEKMFGSKNFSDLNLSKAEYRGKQILLLRNGDITISGLGSEYELIQVAKEIAMLFGYKNQFK